MAIGDIVTALSDTIYTTKIGLDAVSQWEHHYHYVGTLNPIGSQESSIAIATVERLQNDGDDNYGNDLIIFTLDLHSRFVRPGSINELPD